LVSMSYNTVSSREWEQLLFHTWLSRTYSVLHGKIALRNRLISAIGCHSAPSADCSPDPANQYEISHVTLFSNVVNVERQFSFLDEITVSRDLCSKIDRSIAQRRRRSTDRVQHTLQVI
jgi:hypothetical protein